MANTPIKSPKLEWRECTLTLRGVKDGKPVSVQVPGKEAIGTGLGYAIYDLDEQDDPNELIPSYRILHIPSGGSSMIQDDIVVEEEVKRIIAALSSLFNWNRSTEELVADPLYFQIAPDKVRETYRAVHGTFWDLLEEARENEYWGY